MYGPCIAIPGPTNSLNDRDSLNDRIDNLRVSTHTQNMGNAKLRRDNKSGFKGVSWNKLNNNWVAYITIRGKPVNLGSFNDPAVAHAAYMKAAIEHFGEFATGG